MFSCSMWILVPWPRIKPLVPALRVELEPLDHWGSPKRDCVKMQEELHCKKKSVNIKDYFFFTWSPAKLRNATQCSLTLVSATVSLRSVQFSPSVMPHSLWPHALQHSRPPCPSPTPRVYSNSCPLSRWCHPTIASSAIPCYSCLQSFPASGPFQMSPPLASGGQSIGGSASTSVLEINTQDWSPLGWTGWISLQSKSLSRVFSNTTVQKR